MAIKKISFLLAAVWFAAFFVSCSAVKEKTISVAGISISGEGSDYLKVVDGDYTLKVVKDKIIVPVKLELTRKYDGKRYPEIWSVKFIPLDKSGVSLNLDSAVEAGTGYDMYAIPADCSKITGLLKGEVGDTVSISFVWGYYSNLTGYLANKSIKNRIMEETGSFKLAIARFAGSFSDGEIEDYSDRGHDAESSEGGE